MHDLINNSHSELLAYFIFGGIVIAVMGYWLKKTMGALIALLIVLFAYLYFTGSFHRINW
jgi:predicted RND superfamily exporter protein